MKNLRLFTAAIAASLTLAACGGGDEESPPIPAPETVTETEAGPPPEIFEEEPVEETFDEDISDLALQMTWDQISTAEQVEICDGWHMDREFMTDMFMEGAEGSFDRDDVQAFFDGKCL